MADMQRAQPEAIRSSEQDAADGLALIQDPLHALTVWKAVCIRMSVCGGQVIASEGVRKTWYKVADVKGVKVVTNRPRNCGMEFLVQLSMNPPFDQEAETTVWAPIRDVNELVVQYAMDKKIPVDGETSGANVVSYGREGVYYEVEKILDFKHNYVHVKFRNVDEAEWIHRAYLDQGCENDLKKLIQQKSRRRAYKKSKKAIMHAYARLYEAHMSHFTMLQNTASNDDDDDDA